MDVVAWRELPLTVPISMLWLAAKMWEAESVHGFANHQKNAEVLRGGADQTGNAQRRHLGALKATSPDENQGAER